jgi:uncharacterized protein YbjT (DUF2867 family)
VRVLVLGASGFIGRHVMRALAEVETDTASFSGANEEVPRIAPPRPAPIAWQEADVTLAGTALGWSPHLDVAPSAAATWAGSVGS